MKCSLPQNSVGKSLSAVWELFNWWPSVGMRTVEDEIPVQYNSVQQKSHNSEFCSISTAVKASGLKKKVISLKYVNTCNYIVLLKVCAHTF